MSARMHNEGRQSFAKDVLELQPSVATQARSKDSQKWHHSQRVVGHHHSRATRIGCFITVSPLLFLNS